MVKLSSLEHKKKGLNKHHQKLHYRWSFTEAEKTWRFIWERLQCVTRSSWMFFLPPERCCWRFSVWDFEMQPSENICLREKGPFIFWSPCSSPLITDAVTDDWLSMDTYLLNLQSEMRQLPSLMTNCVLSNIFLNITFKSPLLIPTIITCCAHMRWYP